MIEEIKKILVNELDYSDYEADLTASDLLNIQPPLQIALQKWLKAREITNIEISGFTVKQLMEKQEYTFPAAIIAMDWLLTEPDIAKKELSNEVRR